ncbi:MAG TPA: heavy metal-associated domain-containing protein [Pseudonocardiaceae bacterium]|jgi:copper ion binding protein|nr:heavy metal-associated domain-containing protein [Pseudonocardiaceae bacterium]
MTTASPYTATYTVSGMTCQHCVSSVTEELGALSGVTDVTVQLDTGAVTVASQRPLPADEVAAAVDEAGYQLAG